mmetsp:Transcript_12964/g.35887  ORF Transcript_12964/g.35887 Transcript_12964/m.35887 type:complete len:86 (+) Transcript_12964:271-528(+)
MPDSPPARSKRVSSVLCPLCFKPCDPTGGTHSTEPTILSDIRTRCWSWRLNQQVLPKSDDQNDHQWHARTAAQVRAHTDGDSQAK